MSFELSSDLTEVASLRVLCPACLAEHRAKRARQAPMSAPKAAADGKPVGPRPVPQPAAKTRPPAAPAGREATAPSPAPSSAPSSAARPAPAPAAGPRPTAIPARTVASERERPRKPAEDEPAPRKDGKAQPAPKAKPAPAKKHIDLDSLESRKLQKRGSREVLIGFIGAVVVLTIAGVSFYVVMGKKQAEAAAIKAQHDEVEGFRTAFMAMDISTEDGAKQAIAFAETKKDLWAEADFAGEIETRKAKAKTFLEDAETRRTLLARLEEAETVLAKAAELSPTDFAEQRRRLDEIAAKADAVGTDFVARVTKDRADAEHAYFERLMELAKQAAAAEPLDRTGLTTIQLAEDETLKPYEVAYRAWDKDKKNEELASRKEQLEERYRAAITLSDDAVERFFTAQAIESTPWRDLLAADHASDWKWGQTMKGFEHRLEGGVLQVLGPDPSEKAEGVISVGDKEVWRDYVVDVEFTIVRGQFSFFFRLPAQWQQNVEQVDFETGDGYLEAGRSYQYSIRLVGSTLTQQEIGEDTAPPTVEKLKWTKVRKGAFGISIPKETEVKFTRLRVKVLR